MTPSDPTRAKGNAVPTPTPWKLKEYAGGEVLEIQGLKDGMWVPIAAFHWADVGLWQKANAHLIVRAVNAHYELLNAARMALYYIEGNGISCKGDPETGKIIRAAIAKAEEGR